MIFDTFEYYQTGCNTRDPMERLYKYEERLQSGITSASSFLERFNEIGMEEMNEKCGANVRPLVEVISILRDNLGILLGALRSTFKASSCSRVSPIYKQTFSANACEESASGLTLMFMVTVTVAAIGMVMIMLRSAMHPYKSLRRNPYLDQDEKISEHDEYKTYVGYMSEFVNMWKGEDGDASSEPTATWSGSMHSKSEEEKPLSPTTPGISWKDDVFRPTSFLLSPGSNNGEVGHNAKTPRVRPSSLMFSPANRASERNYFNMHSPLSSNSSIVSPSSQIMPDIHEDEEQALSAEPPSIVWDNNWGSSVNKRFAGSSPLSLGSNGGRMTLSPVPDVVNDEEQPLSPETPAVSWIGNKLVERNNVATPSSVVSKDSIPSLRSGNFSEIDDNTQPDSNEVADSLLAVGLMGAVLGMPAPNTVRKKKKKNANLWQDDGEDVDEIPSMSSDEEDTASPESLSASRVNSPNAMNDKVGNVERDTNLLLASPTESVGKKYFDRQPPSSWSRTNMGSPPEDKSDTTNGEETTPSEDSSLDRDETSSQVDSLRTRFVPQLKSLIISNVIISNDSDELEQLVTPQARDDQEVVSDERSSSKRFNVMRFGTPDFLSPLRRGAARDYKKIE